MSEFRVNTLVALDASSPTELTGQAAAKAHAWASTSAVIGDSLNVSGSSDNGVGDYSITLTNNLTNNTYSITGQGIIGGSDRVMSFESQATTGWRMVCYDISSVGAGDKNTGSQAFGVLA